MPFIDCCVQVILKLTTIQSIMGVQDRAHKVAEAGDFARAVEVCLESRQKTLGLSSLAVAGALNARIQSAYSSVQKSIDAALRDSCRQFDASRYKPVRLSQEVTAQSDNYHHLIPSYQAVLAYRLIGKSERLIERLQRHWLAALHAEALAALQPYVKNATPGNFVINQPQRAPKVNGFFVQQPHQQISHKQPIFENFAQVYRKRAYQLASQIFCIE